MRTKEAAAAIIARDHYRYCRQRGDSLRDIAESVGYRMQPDEGEEEGVFHGGLSTESRSRTPVQTAFQRPCIIMHSLLG